MNLGHAIGTSVRDRVREPSAHGDWYQLGRITIQRVREVVQVLDPIRFESWVTQNDERTCPICGQLNGRIWQEGEGFTPPAHDNCRCQRTWHHTEFRARSIEQWRDIAIPTISWVWKTA